VKAYQDAGISITCFGVHGFNSEEDKTRQIFEFAKTLGLKSINADFGPDFLVMAERYCAEYHIKLAVHNHGRHHRWGAIRDIDKLFAESSKNIGLCLDTAWMMDSGEDPVKVAEKYADRLYGVHIKDFVFDRAGRPEDTVIGTGNLDINAFVTLLIDKGFDGTLTLEFEGDENNPIPATRECVSVVKEAFKKLT
jgi:sugar phosphate isomerase/epimerase